MQHTFHLNASNLTPGFLEKVKKIFGNKEIKVVIEDLKPVASNAELYQSTMALIDLYKGVQVDPNLDLANLANEVNL